MNARWVTCWLGFIAVLLTPHARGEVFVLTSGGRIEGAWLNRDAEPVTTYEIAISGGGHVTLSNLQVDRVIVKSEELLEYEKELPTVPDTVDGHWAMAQWCRKAGLASQREIHLRRILELSPDHTEARRLLGYSRVDGEWVKPDQWLARQGYVRHKGAWRLSQEIELASRRERQTLEEQEWRKRLRRWRSSIVRGRNDSAESLTQLRNVDSSYAIAPLAELLKEKNEPGSLKLVYIDVLGRFNSVSAADALLERVMNDPELEIRERSIAALQQFGTQRAVASLSRFLNDKEDNKTVNEAAWALGKLGDPAAIPSLIHAVITKHKFKVYPGGAPGGINAGMGSGGGGLTMGGRPRIVEREFKNPQVLGALTTLCPEGVNFGYNEQAWRSWWAEKESLPGVNLRRDL